jgi:thiosulfate dehydrogenase (quinone) large subunit
LATTTAVLRSPAQLREPPIARFLFADARTAWLWLVVRVYLGYEWLTAGFGKLGDPAWTGSASGTALAGFAKGALAKTAGDHPQVSGWYGTFLQNIVIPNASLFAWLVALGETLVGVALIVGALTGIAAFFGIFMNANYLLAGTVSTNPVLAILGVFIVLAWRNAGWIGLDRWLLPAVGTPWQPGTLFARGRQDGSPETRAPSTITDDADDLVATGRTREGGEPPA